MAQLKRLTCSSDHGPPSKRLRISTDSLEEEDRLGLSTHAIYHRPIIQNDDQDQVVPNFELGAFSIDGLVQQKDIEHVLQQPDGSGQMQDVPVSYWSPLRILYQRLMARTAQIDFPVFITPIDDQSQALFGASDSNSGPPETRGTVRSVAASSSAPTVQTANIGGTRSNSRPDSLFERIMSQSEETAPPIERPQIGHIYLAKWIDSVAKVYNGLNLLNGRFVTVRQRSKAKHLNILNLANRLRKFHATDSDAGGLYELLFPKSTTFLARMEQTELSFYWVEPLTFGSLHALIAEKKRLPEEQVRSYFRQICDVLEFCHSRNVILRDLKLRKFVFADPGRRTLKLDDLDALITVPEKLRKNPQDWTETSDEFDTDQDQVINRYGCPAYVSPEVLDLSKLRYSGKAADIWSLGVLLFVLLTGRYPFYAESPAALFRQIRAGQYRLSTIRDKISFEAYLLIKSMLRQDASERPRIREILTSDWLHTRDYRAAFKFFDSANLVYWRPTDGGSTDGRTPGSLQMNAGLTQITATPAAAQTGTGGAGGS